MLKKEARKIFRQKRLDLSEMERSKLDDLMLISFQSAHIPFIKSMMSYWPIEENNEPDTHLFTEYLRFRNPGMEICYPKSDFETGLMKAIITDIDTSFDKKQWNIHEPSEGQELNPLMLDLVFVPLLAFDISGYRVGYGKGFYDKFLVHTGDDCIKVGFSYFDPIQQITDRDEYDLPLDLYITPQQTYVF